jgi:hypothetical protein
MSCRFLRNPDLSTDDEWRNDIQNIVIMIGMATGKMQNAGYKATWYDK